MGNRHNSIWHLPWFRPFVEEPVSDEDVDFKQKSSRPWVALSLLLLSVLGLAIDMFQLVAFLAPSSVVSCVLCGIGALYICLFRPRTGSATLVALDIGIVASHAASVAQTNTGRWSHDTAWDMAAVLLALISLLMVLNMPLRDPALSREGIAPPFSPPTKDLRSPEDNLTLWQWMCVSWMEPLISIGSQRQLHDGDVWFLAYEFQHTQLHESFRRLRGTVMWRLITANWIDLLILTFLAFVELTAQLAGPMLLQKLLQAMDYLDVQKRSAILYATIILALRLTQFQSAVFNTWFGRRCYERSRGEMITMLHEKVLQRKIVGASLEELDDDTAESNGHAEPQRQNNDNDEDDSDERQPLLAGRSKQLPQKGFSRIRTRFTAAFRAILPSAYKKQMPDSKQAASMGKILNLMRNDVYEVSQRFWEFSDIIRKPLYLICSIILTWRLVGWSCLVGIAVVIVGQILNAFMARLLISWEKVRRQATDHKLQQVSQYIETIRHLRWYGWHTSMLGDVMSARQRELNLRVISNIFSGMIAVLNMFSGGIVPVAVFWAYTAISGGHLRVDIAFPALQLFTILARALQELPDLIRTLINAYIAVGRIEDFMSEPDLDQKRTHTFGNQLQLVNASFSWPGSNKPVIYDASVSFEPGLTIILGPVASGKSALLQSLLGELDLTGGELRHDESSIAYCAQTPWLQSMSIRENVLFGAVYSESRYQRVLESCALLPDLASFEHGDLSAIGENGIGLSGGQKARVALARALYSNAKYLLLDDPISALDQQTAEWIIDKCFRSDLLKDRIVILVTHRTDLCQDVATQIVEMSHGIVQVHDGKASTFDTLQRTITNEQPVSEMKTQESNSAPDKFEDAEHRFHGSIHFDVYWEYIKAGRLRWWFVVVSSVVLWRILYYGQSWFLKEWGEAYKTESNSVVILLQHYRDGIHTWMSTPLSRLFERLPDPSINVIPWLQILLVLEIVQCSAFFLSELAVIVLSYNSGKNMFQDVMNSVSNATFRFYDVTPVGRLMNRITGDVSTVDGAMSRQLLAVTWSTISWLTSLVVIASVTPIFLVCSIILTTTFIYFFLRFLPTSQSLRRLEMVSLSPLMSNFGALLHGLMTVRAFRVQQQFQARVIEVTDAFQKMDHFYWSLQTWLTYRFDIVAALSTFALTMLAIYSGLSPGLTAFVLIAASKFVLDTHILCKQYGALQLDFVSVERVVEFLRLEQEDPGTIVPPASWPNPNGNIEFENVTLRYAPHLPPALKDITMTIPGGSSAAVIGRTGSGKSTMALAMLATLAPEQGKITIDGIDISQVSKQILRARITFLAQEPVLFPGTLRTNLDPLQQYSDAECAGVLDRVGGTTFSWSLGTQVEAGGKNLSQGQRQLVGLARALLRRSSIIIMDEATASIDLETSKQVQKVLRRELNQSTVVGIAHRSSALEGCDLVVRLADGELVGIGAPDAG